MPKAKSVELLWQTKKDLISELVLSDDATELTCKASDSKGNALVAIKDGDGRILWSFHLGLNEPGMQDWVNMEAWRSCQKMDASYGVSRSDSAGNLSPVGSQASQHGVGGIRFVVSVPKRAG